MLKNMAKGVMVFLVMGLAAGCASSTKTVKEEPNMTTTTVKSVETRFYVEDRAREDQSMEEGNFGYISGTPQPEDRSNFKKTRKIYVMEVTKNIKDAVKVEDIQVVPYVPQESAPLPEPVAEKEEEVPAWAKPVAIPDWDETEAAEAEGDVADPAAAGVEEYVVQEGDTLQKIAKKYYDSYKPWVKIYEANKDVLPDPNRIKAGMKLRIPLN